MRCEYACSLSLFSYVLYFLGSKLQIFSLNTFERSEISQKCGCDFSQAGGGGF